MKKLLCLLAPLCLYISGFGQTKYDYRTISKPFYIDNWISRDVPLGRFINYKDTTATLNDFKGKLIILDFWFTQCTDCIAQFPKEVALQKKYGDAIQFILVTFGSRQLVETFLAGWQKRSGLRLSLPVIIEDTALGKAFRHLYDPHYAWIFPDGKIVGQTSEHFVTAGNIEAMLREWAKRKALFQKLQQQLSGMAETKTQKQTLHKTTVQ